MSAMKMSSIVVALVWGGAALGAAPQGQEGLSKGQVFRPPTTAQPQPTRMGSFVTAPGAATAGGRFGSRQGGDTCETAVEIPGLPFADTGTTAGYTDDYDEVCPYPGSTSPDVVYSFTPDDDVAIDIWLCNSLYDTKVYVYENTCGGVPVACNDDACGDDGYKSALYGVALAAGETYYVVVDGYGWEAGTYLLEIEAGVGDGVDCPGDTLWGQPPTSPEGSWMAGTSEAAPDYRRYEDFAGLGAGPANGVRFWGLSLTYSGGWWPCDTENPTVFEIKFYEDSYGEPGTVVRSYTPPIEPQQTVYSYAGYPLNAYSTELVPDMPLTDGWCSIQGQTGIPYDCWFLWISHGESGYGYSLVESGGVLDTEDYDLSLCLTGDNPGGACCDDMTGVCEEDVPLLDCPEASHWQEGGCADLTPECGLGAGACCYPVTGECDEAQTFVECAVGEGIWLGRGSTCAQCPCTYVCATGTPEPEPCGSAANGGCNYYLGGDCNCDEIVDFFDIDPFVLAVTNPAQYLLQYPDCGIWHADCNLDGYIDFFDIDAFVEFVVEGSDWVLGGPAASPIACGETVCGTAWAGDNMRDTDWFELEVEDNTLVTLELLAEFPSVLGFLEVYVAGESDCDNFTGMIQPYIQTPLADCETPIVLQSFCLPGGKYYLFVAYDRFDDEIPGDKCAAYNDYALTVTCEPCTDPCAIECPPEAGLEGEPCGEDTNGGCNMETPAFEPLENYEPVCGTAWVAGGSRDTDWYEFSFTPDDLPPGSIGLDVRLLLQSELEVIFGLIEPLVPGVVDCDTGITGFVYPYWYTGPCDEAPQVGYIGCLPPGTYWFFVAPIFDTYYPCGVRSDYVFELRGDACGCDVNCPPGTPGEDYFEEGELDCHDDYDDEYNGGCWALADWVYNPGGFDGSGTGMPDYVPVNVGEYWCGRSGTYTKFGWQAWNDDDWYGFSWLSSKTLKVQFECGFLPVFHIMKVTSGDPSNPCVDLEALELWDDPEVYQACMISLRYTEACLEPGEYFFVVYPKLFTGLVCGEESTYWFRLQEGNECP